jgi:hypothetical protein
MLPLDIGGLHTSLSVPPLLAAFYIVLGALFIGADSLTAGSEATIKARERSKDPRVVAAAFGLLAADLQLSASLYASGTPYEQISLALAAGEAAGIWLGSLVPGWTAFLPIAAPATSSHQTPRSSPSLSLGRHVACV